MEAVLDGTERNWFIDGFLRVLRNEQKIKVAIAGAGFHRPVLP